jgi:hypothetical protein
LHVFAVLTAILRVLLLVSIGQNVVCRMSSVFLFCGRVLLRLVPGLTCVVMLVVIAFLIDAAAADREFAFPFVTRRNMGALGAKGATPRIRYIVLVLEDAKLLLVRFLSLHSVSSICRPRSTTLFLGMVGMMTVGFAATARNLALAASKIVCGRFLHVERRLGVLV